MDSEEENKKKFKSSNNSNDMSIDYDRIEKAGFRTNTNCDYDPFVDVIPSSNHVILYEPFVQVGQDHWDDEHVKLPHSKSNIDKNGNPIWNDVCNQLNTLKKRIQQLPDHYLIENVIGKFVSSRYQNFKVLDHLFTKEYSHGESEEILKNLIPKIIDLALDLPNKIKSSIPLLKSGVTCSISLTQEQCACILANAFFCTFPCRSFKTNPEAMPFINFNNLYSQHGSGKKVDKSKLEKLKCILHYFKRFTEKNSYGVLTFSRVYIPEIDRENFKTSTKKIRKPVILFDGKIEDCKGALQLDFANKFIGGGVLNHGCVQEEIRFVICPELLVSLLFSECMNKNECILIRGCERYSNYMGYASSFEWFGDYVDTTEKDKFNRILTDVLAIDALHFHVSKHQYTEDKIWREIKKCYIGFSANQKSKESDLKMPCVATGNWGCGAFNGNIELKFLIQLIGATEAGRDLVYFTFNDISTYTKLDRIADLLEKNSLKVGDVFKIMLEYCKEIEGLSSKEINEFGLVNYLECKFK